MIHLNAIDTRQCKILNDLEDFDKCCDLFANVTDGGFDFNKYSKEVFDKYDNDVKERIEIFKGILNRYWKVQVFYKGKEFSTFLFYPYRFIDGNSTLFAITADADENYSFCVLDKSYSVDNYDTMLQHELILTEIDKQEFNDFIDKHCHNVLEYRLRREKELQDSNNKTFTIDEF